jgi:hypothetical protein
MGLHIIRLQKNIKKISTIWLASIVPLKSLDHTYKNSYANQNVFKGGEGEEQTPYR